MKKFAVFIIFFSIFVSANEKLITVGIPPWKKESELRSGHKPLLEYLENSLQRKIYFEVTKDYPQLIEKIKTKQIDVAFFPPNLYVQAKDTIPNLKYLATVLTKDKNGDLKDHYYSVIISLKSSNITSPSDLKGKKVGFTDFASASGYLYPIVALKSEGIEPKRDFTNIFMLKKHSNIIPSLLSGSIDVGATFDSNLEDAMKEHGDIFHIVLKTPPIPFDAYAAAPHLDEKTVNELKSALLKAGEVPEIRDNNSSICPNGFAIKDENFYSVVKDAAKILNQ